VIDSFQPQSSFRTDIALPGPHKIRIDLVNANHELFPGQSKTVTFTILPGEIKTREQNQVAADEIAALVRNFVGSSR
jgi:hypothetical protein